jgi:hypothetical protein
MIMVFLPEYLGHEGAAFREVQLREVESAVTDVHGSKMVSVSQAYSVYDSKQMQVSEASK